MSFLDICVIWAKIVAGTFVAALVALVLVGLAMATYHEPLTVLCCMFGIAMIGMFSTGMVEWSDRRNKR